MVALALYASPLKTSSHMTRDLHLSQPCTVRDFMNYLLYIEHSAENLQFFLWHRSYVTRFHSAKTTDLILAPEWTQNMQDEAFAKLQKDHRDGLKRDPVTVAAVFKGTDFEKKGSTSFSGNNTTSLIIERPSPIFSETGTNPFSTPPRTPLDGDEHSAFVGSNTMSYRTQANEAFSSAGIKAPCERTHTINLEISSSS